MVGLHTRDLERGGWVSRYGRAAGIFYFLNLLGFYIALNLQLVPSRYFTFFVFTFFIVQLILGVAIWVTLLKAIGKWGFLLLAIFAAITVLGILIWRFLAM